MAPILEPEDPFYEFRDGHAHMLRPDRQMFGKSLQKRIAKIAEVVRI